MKKVFRISTLIIGLAFTACNNETEEIVSETMKVTATISQKQNSRVVLTQKETGNIGVTWKNGDAFVGVSDGNTINFTDAIVSDDTKTTFTASSSPEEAAVVNAIYPIPSNATITSTDGFEISLEGQDGTLATLADYNYMTSNATVTDGELNFDFQHEIVILRLNELTFPEDVTSVSKISVSGTGISDVAVANLTGEKPVVTIGNECVIDITKEYSLTDNKLPDVYVAFFPTKDVSNLTITAISDSKPYRYSYTETIDFVAGNMYTLKGKEMTLKYEPGDYYKDDEVEGVVVEVDESGENGKIVSFEETKTTWYLTGQTPLSSANVTASKDSGIKNTEAITQSSTYKNYLYRFPAIKWCVELTGGWYLPAVNEWKTILANKDKINTTLQELGKTQISGTYWTSTQYSSTNAYVSTGSNIQMTYSYSVRAMREFSFVTPIP